MKKRSRRSKSFIPRLAGTALLCVIGFGALAGAGISSPSAGGGQPLLASRAEASLSNLALLKSGKLSPRLQQLSQPSVMKASATSQAETVGLSQSGPGSLLRAADGQRLIVYVRVSGSIAGASEAIENAGATIVNASARYGVITVAVAPSRLQALGKLSVVKSAQEVLAPVLAASTCPSGAVVSEGDTQLAAASARSTYGVDGSGVTVGILSDSFDALSGDPLDASAGVLAGELPGTGNTCAGQTNPVNVLEDYAGGEDEGRAMLEVVHDLAPGASLDFATADTGIYAAADNIRALRSAGARVIADDVSYLDEPMFQEGPISEAIDDVTSSGASYFSAAGNANVVVGGRNVGSYEAPAYRPTSCPAELNAITGSPYYASCHNFAPGVGVDSRADYTLAPDGYLAIDLQWAEPWGGVGTDLDLILIDADTGELLNYSADTNPGAGGTQEPFEITGYQNPSSSSPENVEVVIARYSGAAVPRLKYVIAQSDGVTYAEYSSSSGSDVVGPAIFGHNGGQNTISVAAVPYNNSTTPEWYSSHGPVTYYYGPVSGTTPAAPLSSPLVLSKPDIAATDCAATSFFYQWDGSAYRFCGTSEAAPHAAAVAALMLQRNPAITPSSVLTRLQTTAGAVTNGGTSDVVGSGLINALGAVGVSTPTFAFSPSSYSVSEAGHSAAITIQRTGDTSSATTVHFATANGTATAGTDYTAVSEDVSFAAGVTSQTVTVPIIDAGVIGGSKTVSLALSSPSAGAELGYPSSATLTIQDNDRAFAFSAASYSVNENDGSAAITINRSGQTSGSDTVNFATANGTATAGADYAAVSEDVSFAAGVTSQTVTVPVIDAGVIGGSKTVSLALSSPSSGAILGSPSSATLTIQDNDRAFAFSAASYSVNENGGSATITINRSGQTSGSDAVHFATANGTAITGKDYTAISKTVSFAAGVTSQTVTVPVIDARVIGGSKTVSLALSSPSSGAILGSPSSATLTIQDNDVARPPSAKPSGKIVSCKLSKKSFLRSQARKVKLTCKFSPKSKVFRYVLSLKKGKKWALVKSARKTGSFKTYTATVKRLFASKPIKRGSYRLKLSADRNSKTLRFKVI
jgi:hypothetical protein